MQPAPPAAPAPFTLEYFNRPPNWLRNLVAVLAALLAIYGSLLGTIMALGDEATARFEETGQTLDDPSGESKPAPTTSAANKFFAADSKFRVAFPGQPERSVDKVDEPPLQLEITSYLLEHADGVYIVSTFPFSPGLPFEFDGAAQGFAAEVGGQLDSKTPITFAGLAGVELVVSVDGDTVRALIVRAADRVVQLAVLSADKSDGKYEAFRDSLEVL